MAKLVIIGIDGLDPFLLNMWREDLPNMSPLFNNLTDIMIESTFPPDSVCAWASIYTGENPAEHGLLESIDYLSKRKSTNNKDRTGHFKGNTFWDIAGKKGKTVCVLNPFLAYPAWEVNGIMVSGPVFEGGTTSVYPENIIHEYDFPPLGGMVDFPDEHQLEEFIDRTKNITEQLADAGLKIYRDFASDLFFITFLTLDRVKHFLWRYSDEEDRWYPGSNAYKGVIKSFYVLFDKIIGDFIRSVSNDTSLMIISDHGHRRRCSKCLNLNNILREKGYISINESGIRGVLNKLTEKAKVKTITSMSRYGLQDWIYKIARFIPNRRALKKSTYLIDNNKSSVTLSNLCGTNPYGGIDIKADTKEEYEKIRDSVLTELTDLNVSLQKNIFKWVQKREEIYRGKYDQKFPDILFELDDEYGVGMDFFTSDITQNYTHKKISGGHKKEAVLLVKSKNDKINKIKKPESVIGLKNYILNILSEENPS